MEGGGHDQFRIWERAEGPNRGDIPWTGPPSKMSNC